MQRLVEQHGDRTVVGGALSGSLFKSLTEEQLRRAAKRYPTDPNLQKFAKAKVAILELDAQSEPLPFLPVQIQPNANPAQRPASAARQVGEASAFSRFRSLLQHRYVLYVVLLGLYVCMLKPAVSTLLTRHLVRGVRLLVRQVTHFLCLLVDGVLDELTYQLEFAIREALPSNLEDVPRATMSFLSHVLSATTGAVISLLSQHMYARRVQVAWRSSSAQVAAWTTKCAFCDFPPPPRLITSGGVGSTINPCTNDFADLTSRLQKNLKSSMEVFRCQSSILSGFPSSFLSRILSGIIGSSFDGVFSLGC